MNPAGLDFISVTYDEGGQTSASFFRPRRLIGCPAVQRFVAVVQRHRDAVRRTAVPANFRDSSAAVSSKASRIFALLALRCGMCGGSCAVRRNGARPRRTTIAVTVSTRIGPVLRLLAALARRGPVRSPHRAE
jgi:hypothetical protein